MCVSCFVTDVVFVHNSYAKKRTLKVIVRAVGTECT